MSAARRTALISFIVLVGLVWAWPAAAWRRSRDAFTRRCLWQPQRELVFLLNSDCQIDGSRIACQRAFDTAAAAWTRPACSDVEIRFGGWTNRTEVGQDPERAERDFNLILIRRVTPADEREPRSLSITTYDRATGGILDSDIELYDEEYDLTEADLHNVLVHELGHALGLGHSPDPGAVMYRWTRPGMPKLGLGTDDLAALCRLYPAGRPTPACPDQGDGLPEVGCSAGLPGAGLGMGALVMAGLFVTRRRRQGRIRRPAPPPAE